MNRPRNIGSESRSERRSRAAAAAFACALSCVGPAAAEEALTPGQVFERAAPSVYTVAAAENAEDLKAKKDVKQGSAVAVTPDLAVTNCHVVKDRAFVVLVREKTAYRVAVEQADERADICLLRPKRLKMTPIAGVKPYGDLKVGARAYAIGSPRGLDRSLSEGLISGLRRRAGVKIIQATAPISLGSSGGGLFDAEGNLIGITTFKSGQDSQLNFAVATDEFWPLRAAEAPVNKPEPRAPQSAAAPAGAAPAPIPTAFGERTTCGPIEIRDIAFAKDKTKCITSAASNSNTRSAPNKHELVGSFKSGFILVAATRFTGAAGFAEVSLDRLRKSAEKWASSAKETSKWSGLMTAPYRHIRFAANFSDRPFVCALGQFSKGDSAKTAGLGVWLGYCAMGENDRIDENLATIHRLIDIAE